MRRKIGILVLLSVVTAIILVACINTTTLEDVTWVLESYGEPDNLKTVLEDTEITIAFDSAETKVIGFAGCNSYGGSYELKGNELLIPGPIASTLRSCGERCDDQERQFFKTLETTESYKIEDGKLTISCGNKILVFKRK